MRFVLSIFFLMSLCFSSNEAYGNNENFIVSFYSSDYNGKNDAHHKMGRRQTMMAVPQSPKPDDLVVVVWFHGLGGFTDKTFNRVLGQVESLTREGRSIAVVIPEMPWSANTKTPRSRQGRVWRKEDQFKNFLDESIERLNKQIVDVTGYELVNPRVIIVGHSAGGSAISSSSREGSLCDPRVSSVVWSDASYGSWLEKAHLGCLGKSEISQKVIVRKWDSPHSNAVKFYKKYKSVENHEFIVLDRRQYTHGKIGNNALTLSKLFPPDC